MARIRLTDGSGRWFDDDQAESWSEKCDDEGVSVNTGSLYAGERLYRTKKGVWVVEQWNDELSGPHKFDVIDVDEAYDWLDSNAHWQDIPADFLAEFEI